jgi:hypothetical protein
MRRYLVALLAAVAVPALAQEQIGLGPRVGVFFPASSELRSALGDSWVSIGLGATDNSTIKRKLGLDWNFIYQSSRGNRVFVVTPSFGIMVPLQNQPVVGNYGTQLYAAARAGISYLDYGITPTGSTVRQSDRRFVMNGNVELGAAFGSNWRASVRYDLMPKTDGFDFSGLTLSVTYGIFRF